HLVWLRRGSRVLVDAAICERLARLAAGQGVRLPQLLVSPHVRSPFLSGLWRPAIWLPESWQTDFDEPTLQVILAHELAHQARRDCAWTLLLRLTWAVLWVQPLLWLLARQLGQASEEACDLLALTPDCPPRRYADCLLSLAERVLPSPAERSLGAGVVPVRSSLGRRVQNILNWRNIAMSRISNRLRLAAILATAAVAIGGLRLVSASAPVPPSAPAPVLPAIVGTWIGHPGRDTHQLDTITFLPHGRFTNYNIPAGGHAYGTYTMVGDKLTVRITQEGHGDGHVATDHPPHTTILRFKIVGDTLTFVNTKNGYKEIAHRQTLKDAGRPAPLPGRATSDSLAQANFLAGLTPVQGPGVVVTLSDSKKPMLKGFQMPPGVASPSIIHDTDIEAVVNELKAAGAEAIAVNDQRLIANSSVRCVGPVVQVNNVPQAPPYIVKAIGDPTVLQKALNVSGSAAEQIRYFDPAMIRLGPTQHLTLPAYQGGIPNRYARPVPSSAGGNGQSSADGGRVRNFSIMWQAPRLGATHHLKIYCRDANGQNLVFDRICRGGQSVDANVTAIGPSVNFLLYDNGRLSSEKQFPEPASSLYQTKVYVFAGENRAARENDLSKLAGLERALVQAKIQLEAAREQISVSKMLLTKVVPSQSGLRHLQEQLAEAQGQILRSRRETPPPSKDMMLARMNHYVSLRQKVETAVEAARMHPALVANRNQSRANEAHEEQTIAALDAQIRRLQAERQPG
ncbi:MAG: DUF881 domain-containing protein, partial [Armatimonadota bacterium]|nr:DUF881 domain-containing protein [Armatimonadota bacterium]